MSNMRKNIGKGILYTALSKYSNIFFSIFISAILARLLTPAEFGIVAIVMVFISFFNLLSNFGLGPAVVQFKNLTKTDIESIFSFSILFGVVLSLLFFLSAPLLADFYENEALINLARLMSVSILFQALKIVPNSLILRDLKFKQIGIISVIVHVASGLVSILLAYLGFSYYALVFNSITSGILLFGIFYYLAPIKPVLKINFSSIKKVAKYSLFQFFFNLINYFSRNADNLLIGKFFSPSALGYYDKAYRLMMMPVQNLTHVITPVLHPVLSNYQNDKLMIFNAYSKVVRLLATLGFPISVFLYFSSSEVVNIIYGSQWQESIPVFKLLALTVGIQVVLSSTGSIFQATNRTDLMFYAGLVGSILLVGGISYGIFWGKDLESIGIGLIVAFSINFFQALYLLVKIALEQPIYKFFKAFYFPVITALIIGFGLWMTNKLSIDNIFISFLFKFSVTLVIFTLVSVSSKVNRMLFQEYFPYRKNK